MTAPAAEDFAFHKIVRDVSIELNLPLNFLSDLLHEDDWSFVVKSHALVEGAVTHLLVESTGDARLATFFQKLPLHREGGKVAAVRTLWDSAYVDVTAPSWTTDGKWILAQGGGGADLVRVSDGLVLPLPFTNGYFQWAVH